MGRFFQGMAAAAFAMASVALTPAAEAATVSYNGTFSGGGVIDGRFSGDDLNMDAQITLDELTTFFVSAYAGSPGGPSFYTFTSSEASAFLYQAANAALPIVSGTIKALIRVNNCGGYGQTPCEAMDAIYGPYWGPKFEMMPISLDFAATFASVSGSVPLPGTLPLAAAALGALGMAGRRRRSQASA